MRVLEIQEPAKGQLPTRPSALQQFESMVGTYGSEAMQRLENGKTIVIGGLSLVGDRGSIVYVVGIMKIGKTIPEGAHVQGWSLHLGHPEYKFRKLRFFDTERTQEDTCLPLPNTMVYFACEIDPAFANEDVCADTLNQIAHFVLQFISDAGPPKGIDW